jgi:thioredoxin-related protein
MMKKLLTAVLSLFLLVSIGCASNDSELVWVENLEVAVVQAKEENKNILVNFTGSDWCGLCIKLDKEVFSQKEFEAYANENLVLVKLDFPKKKKLSPEQDNYNRTLANKFGVRGFPTIYLLNKDGQPVNRTGYRQGGASEYVKHLKEAYKGI